MRIALLCLLLPALAVAKPRKATIPVLEITRIDAHERDHDDVVIAQQTNTLGDCYRGAVDKHGLFEGGFHLEVKIDAKGTPTVRELGKDPAPGVTMTRTCVVDRLQRARFPGAKARWLRVRIALRLTA